MTKKSVRDKLVKKLLEEKTTLAAKTYNNDIDIDGDEIDEIQGSLIVSISSQLSSRDTEKLKQIDNALKKLEDNTFGMCEDCGEAISDKRLEVNPYFSTCITCAEQREFQDKQRKRH